MRVLISGAAGMIGRKLTERLCADGQLDGKTIEQLTLVDITSPAMPVNSQVPVQTLTTDITRPEAAEQMLTDGADVIFHLAAIVSGEAEQDFEKGYLVNLDSTRWLLEAIRASGECPKLIFTSSIAVFGAPLPEPIPDTYHCTPLTSYGTQKAIGELLVADYSRRGLVDGVALRLPTICVRPGKPNAAASGFFSGIIREPLNGQEAILPVDEDVLHWHASPRSAIGFLLHAATLTPEALAGGRIISLPGIAVTVGEQIAALRRVAGDAVAKRIVKRPDPFIQKIVSGWPRCLEARRGRELGFKVEETFDEIIQHYIEDEMQ